jgi:hypothetical protein
MIKSHADRKNTPFDYSNDRKKVFANSVHKELRKLSKTPAHIFTIIYFAK